MPGVLPRTPLAVHKTKLVLSLPNELGALGGDRLMSRLKQLARQIGREPAIEVMG
jgi:exopolyphosphatase/guanosine-5'-triphosphate,3'-diphosphate pyrophosphatase